MKIGIIGEGAIGQYVREHIGVPHVILTRATRLDVEDGCRRVAVAGDLPADTELMVDCAGHAALAEHGPTILERGIGLVTVSLGALADPAVHDRLRFAAEAGGARLHLASGAIGALDCLQAARAGGLTDVTYIGRKPPIGWKGSPAEDRIDLDGLATEATHFEGNARQAATRYPKNANVAAAVALAGTGFEATRVKLIADPDITDNIHEVHATGTFGEFSFRIAGKALPDNPRSSALAAMSVVAAIEKCRTTISF